MGAGSGIITMLETARGARESRADRLAAGAHDRARRLGRRGVRRVGFACVSEDARRRTQERQYRVSEQPSRASPARRSAPTRSPRSHRRSPMPRTWRPIPRRPATRCTTVGRFAIARCPRWFIRRAATIAMRSCSAQGTPSANTGFSGPFGPYHSSYDTLQFARTIIDPEFALHRTAGQIYGIAALRLANADVVPYHFSAYVAPMQSAVRALAAAARVRKMRFDARGFAASINRYAGSAARSDLATMRAANGQAGDRQLEGRADPRYHDVWDRRRNGYNVPGCGARGSRRRSTGRRSRDRAGAHDHRPRIILDRALTQP